MTEKTIRAAMHGGATSSVKVTVIRGWDTHPLIVLSIIFTGAIPLAVNVGLMMGLVLPMSAWYRAVIGFGTFVLALLALLILLWFAGRTYWFRQWFIDFARKFFPPSDEVKRH